MKDYQVDKSRAFDRKNYPLVENKMRLQSNTLILKLVNTKM